MCSLAPARAGRHSWALCLALAFGAAYFVYRLPYGWIPSDSGVLAQSASRVLDGEVPHRDFDEYYTGGLTLMHAGAMALFGEGLLAMRWLLLGFALAYLASVYRLSARVAPPWLALGVTLCAAVWSVPNYFVPLPTWYNLFFAVFGVHALFRYLETDRPRWLFVSGLMAGLSLLIKIVSLYVVAATLLTLLYRAQARTPPPRSGASLGPTRLILGGGLFVFVLLLLNVLASRLSLMVVLLYLVPSVTLVALLVDRLRRSSPGWMPMLREVAVYSGGALLPVAVFIAPYATHFGMGELIDDVVLMPQRFYGYHGAPLPEPSSLASVLPWGLLFVLGLARRVLPAELPLVLLAAVPLSLLLLNGSDPEVYQGFWASTRPLFPIVVAVGCLELRRLEGSGDRVAQEKLFALLATAGLFSLVQFPFSAGIYFCFASGLLLLAGLYLVRIQGTSPMLAHATFLAFYAAFALVWLNHGDTYMLGWSYHPVRESVELEVERGGIRVTPAEAAEYRSVVATVRAHAKPGEHVYAAPDAPEVPFLAGRPSPIRTMFDVLDPDYADRAAHDARVLATLEAKAVPVVVLNVRGGHSGAPNPALVTELERRYPRHERIGRFDIRWR